jgi:clan AA aspartic protease (TIGR02281 family)
LVGWAKAIKIEITTKIFFLAHHKMKYKLIKNLTTYLFSGLTGLNLVFTPQSLLAQTTPLNPLAEEVISEFSQCLVNNISSQSQTTEQLLESAGMKCFYDVIMINKQGEIRSDAEARLKAILDFLGVSLPQKNSQGEAELRLEIVPDTNVFMIPTTVGGNTENFLLDTGASNSLVNSELAKKLGLETTTLASDVLEYMVVGDKCDEVSVTVNSLPNLAVDQARVDNLMVLGLPRENIPGKLGGVLGLDFLSNFDLNLNPKTKTLQLLPKSNFTEKGINLQGKMGLMLTEVKINEQEKYTFLLDTGADLVVISQELANKLNLTSNNLEEVSVSGFCSPKKAQKVTLNKVAIQDYEQENIEAIILDSKVLKILGIDGVIGQNFLNKYQQYWRFSKPNQLGYSDSGELILNPLSP